MTTPSLVPGDNPTSPSLRHVGEGSTLDDSDLKWQRKLEPASSLISLSLITNHAVTVTHGAFNRPPTPQPTLSHCRCGSPDVDRRRARGGRRLALSRIHRDRLRRRNGTDADARAFPIPPPTRLETQQSQRNASGARPDATGARLGVGGCTRVTAAEFAQQLADCHGARRRRSRAISPFRTADERVARHFSRYVFI